MDQSTVTPQGTGIFHLAAFAVRQPPGASSGDSRGNVPSVRGRSPIRCGRLWCSIRTGRCPRDLEGSAAGRSVSARAGPGAPRGPWSAFAPEHRRSRDADDRRGGVSRKRHAPDWPRHVCFRGSPMTAPSKWGRTKCRGNEILCGCDRQKRSPPARPKHLAKGALREGARCHVGRGRQARADHLSARRVGSPLVDF
jgi:hypothetical protein